MDELWQCSFFAANENIVGREKGGNVGLLINRVVHSMSVIAYKLLHSRVFVNVFLTRLKRYEVWIKQKERL